MSTQEEYVELEVWETEIFRFRIMRRASVPVEYMDITDIKYQFAPLGACDWRHWIDVDKYHAPIMGLLVRTVLMKCAEVKGEYYDEDVP